MKQLKSKTDFIKMQGENSALILFCAVISAILGAIMAILSHYPPPPYILGSVASGVAMGGIIAARRESRFVFGYAEELDDALDDIDLQL